MITIEHRTKIGHLRTIAQHFGISSFSSELTKLGGSLDAVLIAASTHVHTLIAEDAFNLDPMYPMVPSALRALPKRPASWKFKTLDTLRHRIIQRAGRLRRPQGELTLTMSANSDARKDLLYISSTQSKRLLD